MLKNLLRRLNRIFPFADFLYILQLEEYETRRYFLRIRSFYFRREIQKRDRLIFTLRIKIIFALTLLPGLMLPIFVPIWVGLINFFTSPLFETIKILKIKKAARLFSKFGKATKVVAIAGSFGKTTVKNYIYELVRYNYRTQIMSKNINTPIGIADWIIRYFDPGCELLIVEVDTYHPGEIKSCLSMVPPDIAVLTNIGDQHLERFGGKQELKNSLLEVFKYSKEGAEKIRGKKTNLETAIMVAKMLGIPNDIIADTSKRLLPPPRRGNIININGFEVIDSSYNISETTAKVEIGGASKLAKLKQKKLIVITAGIPELGKENKAGNIHLGEYLRMYADQVILLRSIFYKEVLEGYGEAGNVILASSMEEAIEKLKSFEARKYLVLMLPELTDLYYLS